MLSQFLIIHETEYCCGPVLLLSAEPRTLLRPSQGC